MDEQRRSGRSPAEWITTAVCVGLIVMLCAAILYEGYVAPDDDPATVRVTASAERADERAGQWYVPFEVVNDGDETVEEILVVVELLDGEEVVAEAETTVSLLGEDERVAGMALFDADPRPYTAQGRARSFQVAEE
jgi:uncharacterized protein (TIGR02588 family)